MSLPDKPHSSRNLSAKLQPLKLAHHLLEGVLEEGDQVVDATVGNGHDTAFLARCVGKTGHVYGFDIQSQAILNTRQKLDTEEICSNCFSLHQIGHERLDEYVPDRVNAVVFNLGYLPTADKNLITLTETTLIALEKSKQRLCVGGLLAVMCYPGHDGGDQESDAVKKWFSQLKRHEWNVMLHRQLNAPSSAPFLIAAFRLK